MRPNKYPLNARVSQTHCQTHKVSLEDVLHENEEVNKKEREKDTYRQRHSHRCQEARKQYKRETKVEAVPKTAEV